LTEFEDEDENRDLYYTPDWTASYGIGFSHWIGLSATFNVVYTGGQSVEDYENWNYIDPVEIVTLGSSTVASLAITQTLLSSDRWGKLTLRGDITNLFDEDYAYVKGYPMPGRSFFLGLRYDI
jgi:vitamin B12 transporter